MNPFKHILRLYIYIYIYRREEISLYNTTTSRLYLPKTSSL